jgi:hypothetical protein
MRSGRAGYSISVRGGTEADVRLVTRLVEARVVGLAGALVVAFAATAAGALPVHGGLFAVPLLRELHSVPPYAMALAYFGLALLVGAWWRLGSLVREAAVRPRELLITLAWWTAPLAVTAPLYSRDVYSYLAQGAMFVGGLDVYEFGPAALGGPLGEQVSPVWQHTPAPYGPGFLLISGTVMALAGDSVLLGVLGMRLAAIGSVIAIAWAVPIIARRHGVDPARALWLGVLNPLVLAHLVAGAHNEALMIALVLVAVVLAMRNRPLLAAAVVGVALLVKAPAVVALGFIVAAVWGTRPLRPWPLAALSARVAGAALAPVTFLTVVTGTGFGWIPALGNTVEIRNGLSMTTNVGEFAEMLLGVLGGPTLDLVSVSRTLGLLTAAAVTGYLLLRHRDRPWFGLAVSLLAVVALGPVLNPWYLLWGLVLLAATTQHPATVRWLAMMSAILAFYPMPAGGGPTLDALPGLIGIIAGVAFLPLGRPLAAPLAVLSPAGRASGRLGDQRAERPFAAV